MEKRVIVTQLDGLYYDLSLEQREDSTYPWEKRSLVGCMGVPQMVHESRLEETIATFFRGPVMLAKGA